MDQCVLAIEKFCEEDVGVIRELGKGRENETRLGMTPPRRPKALSREDADDAREPLILFEEETFLGEGCEDAIDGAGRAQITLATCEVPMRDQRRQTRATREPPCSRRRPRWARAGTTSRPSRARTPRAARRRKAAVR